MDAFRVHCRIIIITVHRSLLRICCRIIEKSVMATTTPNLSLLADGDNSDTDRDYYRKRSRHSEPTDRAKEARHQARRNIRQ